jgi:hypothetical protein
MKTTTIIIAAALTLSVNVLFAAAFDESAPKSNSNTEINFVSLAPDLPTEATFEEVITTNDYGYLAPVTPVEAQFEEMPPEMDLILNMAPVTPTVADFETFVATNPLAPTTPAEADFE